MTKPNTKIVNILNIAIGDIVHFYGARFVITSVATHPQDADHVAKYGVISDTMVANGKWLSGAEEGHYFNRNKDWTFQGNSGMTLAVEEV